MNDRNRLRTLGPSPASLPPLSFFFFFLSPFPFFLFRIPTLARVVYLALSCRRATSSCPRSVCARKKHSFIPSPRSPSPSSSSSSSTCVFYRRLSLFKFYIVSIVVVTSRRFDYAPRSATLLFFCRRILRLTAITCHSRGENRFLTRNYTSV